MSQLDLLQFQVLHEFNRQRSMKIQINEQRPDRSSKNVKI